MGPLDILHPDYLELNILELDLIELKEHGNSVLDILELDARILNMKKPKLRQPHYIDNNAIIQP